MRDGHTKPGRPNLLEHRRSGKPENTEVSQPPANMELGKRPPEAPNKGLGADLEVTGEGKVVEGTVYSNVNYNETRDSSPELQAAMVETGDGEPREITEKKRKFPIQEGDVVENTMGEEYQMDKELGAGGMGAVFKATNQRNGMERAVKFMHPEVSGMESMRLRFKREIAVLAKMQNPFILNAIDVSTFKVNDKEIVGFVTELVEGTDLADELEEKGKLSIEDTATYAAEIAFALDGLEKAGVVHRDLKPANVFLQKMHDGTNLVRVGDFGIVTFVKGGDGAEQAGPDGLAKITGEYERDITIPGIFVGTPTFASPEAAQAKGVDHRADLYSLGLIMYEMVSGKMPYDANTPHEYLMSHVGSDPQSFEKTGADVPKWMEDIIMKLLEKDPEDRFQHATEVVEAIKKGMTANHPERLNTIPFIYGKEYSDEEVAHLKEEPDVVTSAPAENPEPNDKSYAKKTTVVSMVDRVRGWLTPKGKKSAEGKKKEEASEQELKDVA